MKSYVFSKITDNFSMKFQNDICFYFLVKKIVVISFLENNFVSKE